MFTVSKLFVKTESGVRFKEQFCKVPALYDPLIKLVKVVIVVPFEYLKLYVKLGRIVLPGFLMFTKVIFQTVVVNNGLFTRIMFTAEALQEYNNELLSVE